MLPSDENSTVSFEYLCDSDGDSEAELTVDRVTRTVTGRVAGGGGCGEVAVFLVEFSRRLSTHVWLEVDLDALVDEEDDTREPVSGCFVLVATRQGMYDRALAVGPAARCRGG